MKLSRAWFIAGGLLVVMAALMIGPARDDSATVDETTVIGAGYTYWTGHRFQFVPEHPPLSQMLVALPLLSMDLKLSPPARALLEGKAGYPWAVGWYGRERPVEQVFPEGRDTWYFFALPEGQLFGQLFVYGSGNDANAMLFRARCMQVLLALAVGGLVFFWVRLSTGNDLAACAALALWVFNPNALAYGHLASTGDIGVTLGMAAAVLCFAWLLERPSPVSACLTGVATGIALVMKFTAITLAPIFVVLLVVSWKQVRIAKVKFLPLALLVVACAWAVLMVVYFPLWTPAPPLLRVQADALAVPVWFQTLRRFLIPRDFFKGVALALNHSKGGHEAYLLGKWSQQGWWYYYPLAFVFKMPVAFVVLTLSGAVVFARNFKSARAFEIVPWIASAAYLLLAMTSKVNIGVRHLLPIVPLLCVGIGCSFSRLRRLICLMLAWQAVVALACYPLYLQFFSEALGGAKNGYRYLVDSNYDWGQDANRRKQFLAERGITHIYLDYFGTQYNIEYLDIPNTRVDARKAQQITEGTLVVSTSELMRPEWNWLRESQQPIARVAHTLIVYQF